MTQELDTQAAILLEVFHELDTPSDLRPELVDGEVVVRVTPPGSHEHVISSVIRRIHADAAIDLQFSGNKGLVAPSIGTFPPNHVIPDGVFVPAALDVFRGAAAWMPCSKVLLVLEVTDRRPELDREQKRRCYARGDIPFYLLVDRDAHRSSLFSDPEDGDYTRIQVRPFGRPLDLPAPFAMALSTNGFG
ncbi:Uma2 family endonuclease [Embleya sp. NPDC127516]|uniref:Uma2 family endonuclease n=1 Tax=Embleya sp. NPDC127516 TaxID=3363990 RepID=UPI00380B4EB5